MTDRFPDAVLREMQQAFDSAYIAAVAKRPLAEADIPACKATGYAAMRAVLEAHENREIARLEEENEALRSYRADVVSWAPTLRGMRDFCDRAAKSTDNILVAVEFDPKAQP